MFDAERPARKSPTRRTVMMASLLLPVARLARAAPAACLLTPEQETGPFYIADEKLRPDIREDRPGIPLTLEIAIQDARDCAPLTDATIDLWHCDAMGVYSGFTAGPGMGFDPDHAGPPPGPPRSPPPGPPPGGRAGFGPPPGFGGPPPGFDGPPPENRPTDKQTFLRGIQTTDAKGVVRFQTVIPGFYIGRTNHIHFKVRPGSDHAAAHVAHVGQIFFPESSIVPLMRQRPYAAHAIPRTAQAEDYVFRGQSGALTIARLMPLGADPAQGFAAAIAAAVDPTATPPPAGGRPR